MKTMKTNDESTYLSLNSKNKMKTNHKLKYNNTKFTNKSEKNLYYDKIWKYQPKKGINITKNIFLYNHLNL